MRKNAGLEEEFIATCPELDAVKAPPDHPRPSLHFVWEQEAKVAAQRAAILLKALAGWIDGMIAEQTLEARIQAEAAERVRKERRPPTGFSAPDE